MARQTDFDADLTLELNGTGITPSVFRKGVNAFVGLLEVLTASVCGDTPAIEWQMQVRAGSNLIGASAADSSDRSKVGGVRKLAARCLGPYGMEPPGTVLYPDGARKHLRDLAKLSGEAGTKIRLLVGKESYEIVHTLVKPMQSLPPHSVALPGSVEGYIATLYDGGSIYFEVHEHILDHKVKCVVEGDLVEKCKNLWRKRVTVHGIVHYDPNGLASKVDVEDIVPFPPDNELPSYMDVRGILRKYK